MACTHQITNNINPKTMTNKINPTSEVPPATSEELQQKPEAPTENTAELLPDESEVMTARKGRNPQKPNEVIEIPAKKIVK